MKVLLHVCCGPCAAYPVQQLRLDGYEITGYFYNPNIHPYKEFRRRLETAAEFGQKVGLDLIINECYDLEEFLRSALEAPLGRCYECYRLRLTQAARYAKENGFDSFTSSLLVSPYQKHEMIKEVGEDAAKQEGIPFLYYDFRPGWQQGVEISKDLELYRQPYCGCIFSERDRYKKTRKEKR
ncbi:MAG: queH [Firmicutes bacterium]|nr:queH [Bacillota bacterium]